MKTSPLARHRVAAIIAEGIGRKSARRHSWATASSVPTSGVARPCAKYPGAEVIHRRAIKWAAHLSGVAAVPLLARA